MGIKIKNLNFSYGDKQILKNINMEIQKGKLIGILGPNGCGKTTLLKNILGYINRNTDSIEIFGKKEKGYSQKEKARIMAFVPQKSSLMTDISVEDFVVMGRLPHLKNNWEGYTVKDKEISRNILKMMKLEKFEKRIALSLSGGEFQKVLLARALTQEPKILLLDEPTSALDLNHAVELMQITEKLVKDKNITSVVVLHDLNLASMFCEELYMMKDGEVLYRGTPKEIMTKEILKEIYNLNCEIVYGKEEKPYILPVKQKL